MSIYQAPSMTKYKCTVEWIRGKYEDGYAYAVWDGRELISSGGLGHKPYRWRCDPAEETNLPTVADLVMDSWGYIEWDTPVGHNLIRRLIDDAWEEAIPDELGPPQRIRKLMDEALHGPAGATQKRQATA